MIQEILGPGVENSRDSQRGFEVVPTELQQSGGSTGEQEGVKARLVVLNERVKLVRKREHDVKVRDGQQVLALLLEPLSSLEPLATGTMTIPAGVGHEMLLPAMGTLILMSPQRPGVTGGNGAKDLPVMSRQTMSLREARQCGSHDLAQGNGLRLAGP